MAILLPILISIALLVDCDSVERQANATEIYVAVNKYRKFQKNFYAVRVKMQRKILKLLNLDLKKQHLIMCSCSFRI